MFKISWDTEVVWVECSVKLGSSIWTVKTIFAKFLRTDFWLEKHSTAQAISTEKRLDWALMQWTAVQLASRIGLSLNPLTLPPTQVKACLRQLLSRPSWMHSLAVSRTPLLSAMKALQRTSLCSSVKFKMGVCSELSEGVLQWTARRTLVMFCHSTVVIRVQITALNSQVREASSPVQHKDSWTRSREDLQHQLPTSALNNDPRTPQEFNNSKMHLEVTSNLLS
jgi:hypothetical protein